MYHDRTGRHAAYTLTELAVRPSPTRWSCPPPPRPSAVCRASARTACSCARGPQEVQVGNVVRSRVIQAVLDWTSLYIAEFPHNNAINRTLQHIVNHCSAVLHTELPATCSAAGCTEGAGGERLPGPHPGRQLCGGSGSGQVCGVCLHLRGAAGQLPEGQCACRDHGSAAQQPAGR